MTLEQLRIFVAVAHIEHFTRAAERLGISQSVVSAAIAALEDRYKVKLFDRVHRRVEITAAGDKFLVEAEEILARVDLATRRLEDLADLQVGHVTIAASQTVANHWLPPHLVAFGNRYPALAVDVWFGNSLEVEKRVFRGEADIGIIERYPGDETFTVETLITDELVAVVGPHHSWYRREHVGWHELPQTSWIMREQGSGTRSLFEDALKGHGISPTTLRVALTLRTGEAIRSAVLAGTSAAVISSLLVDSPLSPGILHQLIPISIPRQFNALLPSNRPMSRATSALLEHLRFHGAAIDADH